MSEKQSPNNLNSQPDVLFFKGRFLPKLPDYYVEPSLVDPSISPHGAMPANPFLNESVKERQKFTDSQFMMLYKTPPRDTPKKFVEDVVVSDYIINENRRKMDNREVFMNYKASGHETLGLFSDEISRFESGQASMGEIATIALGTPIPSVEFGKVSHPYGYRMQEIEPMRREMSEAIIEKGGVVYPSVTPYRSIKILPRVERFDDGTQYGGQRIIGFIVKYKRDYGHIPVPGTDEVLKVVERQIAAFRVDDESGFDQTVLQAMHDFREKYPKRVNWDRVPSSHDNRGQKIFNNRLKTTGCTKFIETAVQSDSLEDFVVPISTLLYGYKENLPPERSFTTAERIGHVALEAQLSDYLDTLPGADVEPGSF